MKPNFIDQHFSQFSFLDIRFAKFISELEKRYIPELEFAAALLSRKTREGHICLNLYEPDSGASEIRDNDPEYPLPKHWYAILKKSVAVGEPGEFKPLILNPSGQLYLYRYWEYQKTLADAIRSRVQGNGYPMHHAPQLKNLLNSVFQSDQPHEIDWQLMATFAALTRKFCVISGGPGTGKTTTVANILNLLIRQSEGKSPRIALCAPTGKAAARLKESILREKQHMNDTIRCSIPDDVTTLHRLLKSVPDSPYFRHNTSNPLPADVIVVDEASMVDLPLMAKLVQAMKPEARLIILGDKDQLASVEPGAILGDICDTGSSHRYSECFAKDFRMIFGNSLPMTTSGKIRTGIWDCIVHLKKNYRFDSDSGIGSLSHAIQSGTADSELQKVISGQYSDITWKNLPPPDELLDALHHVAMQNYRAYLKTDTPAESYRQFNRFRILCAVRKGPYGVAAVNTAVEKILSRENLIYPDKLYYAGRPILISSNDYRLRLFNGDVGLILRDPLNRNELRGFFFDADGKERKIHHLRLPHHETVFSMTVHKSQGSEFDSVLLILPDHDVPILTRELIYTAVTRARTHVEIWAHPSVFRQAVSRRIHRTSGLRNELWQDVAPRPVQLPICF